MTGVRPPLACRCLALHVTSLVAWAVALDTAVILEALAQERPSEAEIFSAGSELPSITVPTAPTAPPGTVDAAVRDPVPPSVRPAGAGSDGVRDAQLLGGAPTPLHVESTAPSDPLQLGGQLYLRAQSTGSRGQALGSYSFGSPSLLDLYLDARPNDRVRGFVLERMLYDGTLASNTAAGRIVDATSATGGSVGSPALDSLFAAPTRGLRASLDQMWLRFDLSYRVFLTVGTQHVRWGTGRFWAPSDYLHVRRRNPLDVFDARTGTTMLKVHVPVESKAWNFYAYALSENYDDTSRLGSIAGAARAELVLGPAELGVGALVHRHDAPKYAADLSMGIGDIDAYAEVALRDGKEIDRVHVAANAAAPAAPEPPPWQTPDETAGADLVRLVDTRYPVYQNDGLQPQVVGGLTYSRKYNDNDVVSVGVEYFYNALGYPSSAPYPGLVLPHSTELRDPATFFYLGRQYGALFVALPAPGSLDDHAFTVSTLGNFSDRSFITRLDYSFVALTHLRFEAFASARYGKSEGEFRFGVEQLQLGAFNFSRAPAIIDLGVALRIAL